MTVGIVFLVLLFVIVIVVIIADHRSRQVRGYAARVRIPRNSVRRTTPADPAHGLSGAEADRPQDPGTRKSA